MEIVLAVGALVVGFFAGRLIEGRNTKAKLDEVERAWALKLAQGDRSFTARLHALEAEIETLGGRPPGSPAPRSATAPEKQSSPSAPPPDAGTTNPAGDDLTKLTGIDTAIERILRSNGLRTYRQLADATPEELRSILEAAGIRNSRTEPSVWPHQAALAADERWAVLRAIQELDD